MTTTGWTCPTSKCASEHLLAGDRLDVGEEDVGVAGALRAQGGHEGGQADEDERGDYPDGAVVPRDEAGQPLPQARAGATTAA